MILYRKTAGRSGGPGSCGRLGLVRAASCLYALAGVRRGVRGAGHGAAAAAAVGAGRGASVARVPGAGTLRGALAGRAAARRHDRARPLRLQVRALST